MLMCSRLCTLSFSLSLSRAHTHIHTYTQVEEFNSLVDEEYYDWVAQYLVMKRTSIEPNFHSLYMNCLDTINKSRLNKAVLRETYRNIKVRQTISKVLLFVLLMYSNL